MARLNDCQAGGHPLKRTLLVWFLPHLRQLQPVEWGDALHKARATEFDTVERICVYSSLVVVTYLLRFESIQAEALSLSLRYLIQFLVATPLLVLLAGPFYLRCLRRGLDMEIKRRQSPG